jgi:hypothetical protein
MDQREFAIWTDRTLRERTGAAARLFRRLPGLLERGVDLRQSDCHAFESAWDSDRGAGVLKLIHLHRYSDRLPPRDLAKLEREKADRVLEIFEAVERVQAGFGTAHLARVLARSEASGSLSLGHKLGVEFDADGGRFTKLTHYFRVVRPAQLAALAGPLELPAKRLEELAAGPLDGLGLDYFPDGTFQLKVYRRCSRAETRTLAGLPGPGALGRGAGSFPWTGVLLRIGRDGRPLPKPKRFYRLRRGLSAGELERLPGLAAHRTALGRAAAPLAGQKIYYVAFVRSGCELYVRKTAAAWDN